MRRSMSGQTLAFALALGLLGGVALNADQARADVSLIQSPAGQNPLSNVLFNDGGETGFSVTGHLNDSPTTFITYSSTTELLAAGGQANISANGGGTFNNLTWSFDNGEGWVHEKFLLIASADGFVTITATVDEPGAAPNTTPSFGPLAVSANGTNWFQLFAVNGEAIISMALSSTVGISSFQQDRVTLAGAVPPAIPVPGALILFGTGLAGLALLRRRRHNAVNA